MKKYIYRLFIAVFATVAFTACTEDEGTEPGNDSNPVITIYQYKVSKPLNSDNDTRLRFAANSPTSEAYYLAEKTTDKNDRITSIGEEGYKDYVISHGTKINGISGESNVDVTLTDLFGEYTITSVAVGGGLKSSASVIFTGLDWSDKATGTYTFFKPSVTGIASRPTTLQVCTTDEKLYRFKDVFGTGYHMKINLLNLKGNDADGEYTFFRIPVTETSFTYSTYGTVSVRDIGYWQGNDAWVTENGYESGMYADYSCFVYIQYFVSAGSLGYGYDMFIPD
ncbi:hypothetical protein [Dysgonomonas sp.]|jgi:hypothetical protein